MSLSTLIVQREIASIREVEEALARQVLYGGDFVTNLLEVSRAAEAKLMPLVAESMGLEAAPPGELPRPDAEARRVLAAETAVERNIAVLSVTDEGLVLAVATPLTREAEQELAFALALPILQRLAPLVRIRQAHNREYGIPLDRRYQRLLTKLTEGSAATGSIPPDRGGMMFDIKAPPRPPSLLPPPKTQDARAHEPEPEAPKSPREPEPLEPLPTPPRALPDTFIREHASPAPRPIKRRRGPLALDVARNELEDAEERDTIVDIVFEFARQFFDYTALFAVHGDVAEGRNAFGDGAPREKLARIAVPLDMQGLFGTAKESRGAVRGTPQNDGLDAVLMRDLERPGGTECAVLPITVRGRVVALLFGDGGESGLDTGSMKDVTTVVSDAATAFESVIFKRKLKGTNPPPDFNPPAAVKIPAIIVPPSIAIPESIATETAREPQAIALDPAHSIRTETAREPHAIPMDPVPELSLPPMQPPAHISSRPPAEPFVMTPPGPSVRPTPSGRPGGVRRLRATAPPLDFSAERPVPSIPSMEGRIEGQERSRVIAAPAPSLEPAAPVTKASPSPKAESPPPPRMAVADVFHGKVTDRSPVAYPFPHTPPGPPIVLDAPPLIDRVDQVDQPDPVDNLEPDTENERVTLVSSEIPAFSAVELTIGEADVDDDLPEDDATPIAPSVSDDVTPIAPSVSEEDLSQPAAVSSRAFSISPLSPNNVFYTQQKGKQPPESEQQISVPAHRPPSSRSDASRVLPSVIVDVASEYLELVDKVIAAGGDDAAEDALLRAGGYAMPAIMARFPGPITVEATRLAAGALPRVSDCGPVLRLVAAQRRTALPNVLAFVESRDAELRFWATFLLTELVYPDIADVVTTRVFDNEPRVRRVARAAARILAESQPAAVVTRLETVAKDPDAPTYKRVLAVKALGEARESLAVPVLIPLLDDDPNIADAAHTALVTVARQDFATDAPRWLAWWSLNKERHRIEWLIDALMHGDSQIRNAAGDELKTVSKEVFGYYDDLPRKERERSQARYREWWTTVGRIRFSRAGQRGA